MRLMNTHSGLEFPGADQKTCTAKQFFNQQRTLRNDGSVLQQSDVSGHQCGCRESSTCQNG